MKLEKQTRNFLPEGLAIDHWDKLLPYFEDLNNRELPTADSFVKWLKDRSELEAILEEDMAWRYIRMTIDTRDEAIAERYSFFVNEINPKAAPYEDLLNKKLINSPFVAELEKDAAYAIYFRSVRKSIELFREENIELETKIQTKTKEFGAISAAQSINWGDKELTMQQASNLLKEQDETVRKGVFEKMTERRKVDYRALNDLFNELIELRHQVALNAGFDNFRDYKFAAMGRFDYTKEDCFNFHEAIRKHIVPLARKMQKETLDKFQKTKLEPWNTDVDPDGKAPLKPFTDGKELLSKTKAIFSKMDPYFLSCLEIMENLQHLDLDSKPGKAPGGYNYPLYEIGVPFIFMNAAGSQRDVVTMIHEGGHAVHSFLNRELALTAFKNIPSEVAELASMSMELMSMDHWDEFYRNKEDLQRAKREQLVDILKVLPWIATIDAFQHWIYENPAHSEAEREVKWNEILDTFGNPFVNWNGYEDVRSHTWQRQLHLFEVPFYYIEYGMAQLGALSNWKNYLNNPQNAISNYKSALSLGYTKSIPAIYQTANISFDFSDSHLSALASFIEAELDKLND